MSPWKIFKTGSQCSVLLPVLLVLMLLFLRGGENGRSAFEIGDAAAAMQREPDANAAIARYEPALAVRAAGCITCHAKINSRFITDFGYGDSYFFGNPRSGNALGPFGGHIYGDFYGGEPNKTGWLTAEISKGIVVPRANLEFDLKEAAPAALANQPAYREALQAISLAKYLQAVENQKSTPSTVGEVSRVFIGAPSAATIQARFNIAADSDVKFKFIKNDARNSPDIQGIVLNPGKGYYTNSKEVVCDGDLFVTGTLFLNQTTIATISGCRIYATGPIFLQRAVAYKSLSSAADIANLQLVSAEAIVLGIGEKNCDTKAGNSPLSTRLLASYARSSFVTRDASSKSISPQSVSQSLYDNARRIDSLEDASCHDDSTGFSHMLLNAPQVHSRYKGRFYGIVIAEFAMFRQGKSSYEFDPVFKKVPILPLLKSSDYLLVE
jgi:hypothetical protein